MPTDQLTVHMLGRPCGAESIVDSVSTHFDDVTCLPCRARWDIPGMTTIFTTKDSGERRQFTTGSQRDLAVGKGRYDLLPREAVHRLAQLYERGAEKYDPRNWEKGQPFSAVVSSMLRHAFQAAAGEIDEDHLAAVAWNAFALITMQERIARGTLPPELDDLTA